MQTFGRRTDKNNTILEKRAIGVVSTSRSRAQKSRIGKLRASFQAANSESGEASCLGLFGASTPSERAATVVNDGTHPRAAERNSHDVRGGDRGVDRPHLAVAPDGQVDCAPIPVDGLAEFIVRKDEHGRFGPTVLRIGIFEGGGEDDLARIGFQHIRKGIIAIPWSSGGGVEEYQPSARCDQAFRLTPHKLHATRENQRS